MKSKAAVRRIVEALKKLYPDALCSLQYQKDYELLFAVRLSAQCTDARVNMVTPALYAKFPTLEAFANASYEEVGEAIKSCGFYNTKSKDLVECAKILLEKYGGRVSPASDARPRTSFSATSTTSPPMSATRTASASRAVSVSPTAVRTH